LRILWVKAGKLLPVDSGGKIRSYNILRQLGRNHQVTLLSYYGGRKDPAYDAEIQGELPGAKTLFTAALDGGSLVQSLDYGLRIFQSAPFAVTKFTHRDVKRIVSKWLAEDRFDVAVCDFLSASLNFPDAPATPTILFQHNVETTLWQRMASGEANPVKRVAYKMEARKMLRYETAALRKFQHIISVSEQDRSQMKEMQPLCPISVVPTGVDTRKYAVSPAASSEPPRIVFLGSMDWEPNVDAVSYFCQQIFPRVRVEFPSAIFEIVGRNPHPRVRELASAFVNVTGTVPSVESYLRDATLVVVPLRIGGGTRLKIFEAMAMGKAVVSTSIGAEGLEVQNGRDLILASDPESFSDAIILLLRDSSLRRRYEQAAAKLVTQYDWSIVAQRFSQILQETCDVAHPSRRP
jgi:glycosyltransferase involved in cell wall biosynthesis